MSTVIRPVGPLGPKVYWIRRAVLLGVILIIILLVATQCGGGGGAANTGSQHPKPHGTPIPHLTTTPTNGPCTSGQLAVAVSTDTTTYTSGQAPTLTATLRNPSTTTCKLARLATDETWTIKSGTATVWTTAGCVSSTATVPASARVVPGGTKSIHTVWDGHVQVACKDGDSASPGTYRLYASIDGVKATHPAIFHIIS